MQVEITPFAIAKFESGRRRTTDETSDWLWIRGGSHGYGQLNLPVRLHIRAHVFAWAMASGVWPTEEQSVCHTCDVRACTRNDGPEDIYIVNGVAYPRYGHLWLGTQAANLADMFAKGRGSSGDRTVAHLLRGDQHHTHTRPELVPRGERQKYAKLTTDSVREIRALQASGMTHSALAIRFGVSRPAITLIVLRKNWKHVA